jgi:ribosomal-protein-alanine N-acetyltransferase
MSAIIETERLILRRLEDSDAEAMFEMDSDPMVHEFTGTVALTDVEQSQSVIRAIQAQYNVHGTGRLAVIEKGNKEFVGWAGIKFDTVGENGQSDYHDIGFRFIPRHWGKGYGMESATALVRHAFLSLDVPRLVGIADVRNIASNKILQGIGLMRICAYIDENGYQCNWYEISKA